VKFATKSVIFGQSLFALQTVFVSYGYAVNKCLDLVHNKRTYRLDLQLSL